MKIARTLIVEPRSQINYQDKNKNKFTLIYLDKDKYIYHIFLSRLNIKQKFR